MATKITQAEVVREGKKMILPEKMSLEEGVRTLERQMRYEEEYTELREKIDCFVWDGAIALQKAIRQMFGWVTAEPTPGFFGDQPPQLIGVQVGPTESVLVPWGEFSLPGITGRITTMAAQKDGRVVFAVKAMIKRKSEETIKELFELTLKYAKEESIYKGKAVKIRFKDGNGDVIAMPQPAFLDLSKVKENEIMFSPDVDKAIATSLFTPIEKSELCRQHQIPLKRGVLLAGPYGTGKTLAAYVTAAKCLKNNWTFLYCERADELEQMVKFAHQYQPAVVFCEDIDRVVTGDRSVEMDDILNIVDGIESKRVEIMVVLTTNHVQNINKAMLRPGRLDAVINVLPPDAQTVERLIRLYGRGLVPENTNLKAVGVELAGKIPAVIRECVERAKLAAIKLNDGDTFTINGDALLEAAKGMRMQLDLLETDTNKVPADLQAGQALGRFLAKEMEVYANASKNGVSASKS